MAKKKLTNLWTGTLPLQLATHDAGKGYEHCSLKEGESMLVEEEQLTDVIKHLSKKTKVRKPALLIEDYEESSEADSDYSSSDTLQCDLCDRTYKTERGLAQHMETHEEELLSESDQD